MKKVENGSYKGDIPPWVCIPGIPWGGNNYGFLPPKYQGFCVGNPNDQYFKAPGVSLSPDELKRFEKRRALLEVVSPAGKGQTSAAQAADALRKRVPPAHRRRQEAFDLRWRRRRGAIATAGTCSGRVACWPGGWRNTAFPSSMSTGAAAT